MLLVITSSKSEVVFFIFLFRSDSRKTPTGSGPPSYTSNGNITHNGTSSSPSSKIHEVSTIPYRHSETPKEPLRPPPLFDPRPTPTSDPRSPFESGSYDNYGADLGDGFSRTSGSPVSGARTDSSLSTQKVSSHHPEVISDCWGHFRLLGSFQIA